MIVFIIYSVNLAFVFLFPFAIHGVHGMAMDKVSLLTIPGYVLGASTAAMSGAVSRRLDSRQAVTLALCLLALALAVAGVFINVSVVAMVVAMAMFSVGFGLLYAPLMSSALLLMPAAKSGVAVGFYNLVINVASPIGEAYTAMLMSSKPTWFAGLSVGGSAQGDYFSTILWFLVGRHPRGSGGLPRAVRSDRAEQREGRRATDHAAVAVPGLRGPFAAPTGCARRGLSARA